MAEFLRPSASHAGGEFPLLILLLAITLKQSQQVDPVAQGVGNVMCSFSFEVTGSNPAMANGGQTVSAILGKIIRFVKKQ